MTTTPPFALRAAGAQEPEPDLTTLKLIHRAMRQDLQRLAACLAEASDQAMPPSQARAIGRYTTALFAGIRRHHDNEDHILWPLIAATAGEAVDLTPLTDDHRAIDAAISQALAPPGAVLTNTARLRASVNQLRDMLDEHIADEEQQILPAMRRYLPAGLYRRCEQQIQRKAPLASLRFTASWLARYAQPHELILLRAAQGGPARIFMTAARSQYARLERRAFGASSARRDTRYERDHAFRSPPGDDHD